MHRNNSTITGFFSPMTNATTELKSSWQFVTHFGGESRKSILVETIIGSKSGHCIRRFTHRSEVSSEIFIAGNFGPAPSRHHSRLLLDEVSRAPGQLRNEIRPVLESGKEVGLRCSIIARPTREEAIAAAHVLTKGIDAGIDDRAKEKQFAEQSDALSTKSLSHAGIG
jgi:hypothetical protein